MSLISIHRKLLTSASHAWRESNTDENFRTALDLVHSDVCGKMNGKPLSGGAYFMTFTDDKTHYVWIYILKHKDEVFPCFLEWKTLVKKSLNQKVKALRNDNGGGFESARTVIALVVQIERLESVSDGCVNQVHFQSAVRSLLYLSIMIRPDITYAVINVTTFCVNPCKQHWIAVKRNMRYLKGTLSMGFLCKKNGSNECVRYSDADLAADTDDCTSLSAYMFQTSGAVSSWRSMEQTCVTPSTANAEYTALASAAQEVF